MGVRGAVSEANSLVGTSLYDRVGSGGVRALSNGNYVVLSSYWNGTRGAATWGDGTHGISGTVSEANSLIGSDPDDAVGASFTPLSNGNYLVRSVGWGGVRGEVIWGDGTVGVLGTVSEANSLVGSNRDLVGGGFGGGITLLSNGNYLVLSPEWNTARGAVTWGDSTMGVSGAVSDVNSLVGSNPNDVVGSCGFACPSITTLTNSNYLVGSTIWNGDRGAATWGDGRTGIRGAVSEFNSLIGSNPGDAVGAFVTPLSNGNYVVLSPNWNGARRASTWGNGTIGIRGLVSQANSLVGSSANDRIGYLPARPLSNGDYIVQSPTWNGNRGALTLENGASGETLDGRNMVTPQNSLLGHAPNSGLGTVVLDPDHQSFLAPFLNDGGGRVTVGLSSDPNLTAADSPITFNDSVVLNAGLTLNAGSTSVNFVAGTVASDPGVVTVASAAALTDKATFSATLNGTGPGSFSQFAAGGPIDLGGSTLTLVIGLKPPIGSSYEILTTTDPGGITGTFAGLDEGAIFSQGDYQFHITYQGGANGTSVVLTRVA